MNTSLSDLVDNLSKVYKKECKGYEERKKIKSVCKFIGLKNNKLHYKREECKKTWLKPINGLIKKYINFVMETLINLFCYYKRCLSLWIHG